MPRPKARRDRKTFSVSLATDVVDALDDKAKESRMFRNELIESYLRYMIDNETGPRFPLYEFVLLDWVVIYDRLARRLVVVGIEHEPSKPIWCYYDNAGNCEHCQFVKTIPIFHDIIKKRKSS